MSILSSLYSGASGLNAQSDGLAVVGDNIANINTVGFKDSRGSFADVLGLTVQGSAGNSSQIGQGVTFGGVQQIFTQGSLQTTGVPTDVALNGGGFFVVKGSNNGVNGNFYTRDGEFQVNSQGVLVNQSGLQVQGYSVDASGNIGSTVGPLQIAGSTMPAQATGQVSAYAALDSTSTPPPAWNAAQASTTSNYSTSVPVYDSLGNAHTVQIYFRNTGVNGTWEWHAVADGGDIQGGVKGTPVDVADGTMAFSNTGALSQVTTTKNTINFSGGAAQGQVVNFNFGDAIATGGTGLKGTTANAQTFAMNSLNQDGYASGTYNSLNIQADGTIEGTYTNGQQKAIGKLAVASFNSVTGLQRDGNSLWSATTASGVATVGTANTGSNGSITAGALEQSNVDLTTEFVNMIALERGFQANSKTIQTADENYQTLIQIKR